MLLCRRSCHVKACICIAIIVLSSAMPSEQLTVYEVLEEYGFPVGLLPTNVESYTLDTSDGSFEVYLSSSCSFKVDGYRLKYKKKITGKITADSLKDLSGISVKVWFFYLSISEVIVEGDDLEFYAGLASASFPESNFDESPECGCGFDCSESSPVAVVAEA
eukprot:Gb_27093 [translate_table: standard]